jgi:tetratricopeptide (TPR) repeat protein
MRKFIVSLAAAMGMYAAANEGVTLNSQGLRSYEAGLYRDAEGYYRRALEAFSGEQSLARSIVKTNLGIALRAQGRLPEAETLLTQALVEIRELTGTGSTESAQVSNKLAAVYLDQRRFREATNLLQRMAETGGDRNTVVAYGNLAVAAMGLGEIDRAEEYARRGVTLAEQILPGDDPGRAAVLNNLGQACRFTGKYLEAEQRYREAIAIWEVKLGPSHPDLARGLMNLAAFYHDRGREAGAEQLYLRAYDILSKPDPVTAVVVRNELADVMRGELRYTEAEKLARATLVEMEGVMRPEDPRLQRAWMNWARLLSETHRSSEAAKIVSRLSSAGYVPSGR